jgi:hypothetical protein
MGAALLGLAAGHWRDGAGQARNRRQLASQGFRFYWQWRSRRPGRPRISADVDLILSTANS